MIWELGIQGKMLDRTGTFLLTDLYEITMSAAFFQANLGANASFELSVRRLPENRGYLIAAGLEHALSWLESARFQKEDIDFIRKHPAFRHVPGTFFEFLSELRFTGDVWAVSEGTIVFPDEPILRITAPIIQAQLVETYLLAAISYQTSVATKASRLVFAAHGKEVIEFGARRAHGPGAANLASRAAFIGGCIGTSNVEAGRAFQIPTFGTMAHSYVMALEDESAAFASYSKLFPETSILLIDTYDTLAAVDRIVKAKLQPAGVRIDSGDLAELAVQVRKRLDAAGLRSTKILLSGDLDESKISELLASNVPVDGFGVGTSLVVSTDAPSLGAIYKLVEMESGEGKTYHAKLSEQKVSYPGTKQVYRYRDAGGMFAHDLIACSAERSHGGEPLLQPVLRNGKRVIEPPETLARIRDRVRQQTQSLPRELRRLRDPAKYEVQFSDEQKRLLDEIRRRQQKSASV